MNLQQFPGKEPLAFPGNSGYRHELKQKGSHRKTGKQRDHFHQVDQFPKFRGKNNVLTRLEDQMRYSEATLSLKNPGEWFEVDC